MPLMFMPGWMQRVREVGSAARREVGIELMAVQAGEEPGDWKQMTSIGVGVREIRIRVENAYRVIYLGKFAEAVYVLHAFAKKTPKTAKHDLDLAGERYREVLAATCLPISASHKRRRKTSTCVPS